MQRKSKRIILLFAFVIMLFALNGCGKQTIDLNKYVTITSEGFDSMGTASYDVDYDAYLKDYEGKIKVNEKKETDEMKLGSLMGDSPEQLLNSLCIYCSLDKKEGLSNGDTVTLVWECEDEMAEECFNVILKHSDIKYTVEGLSEVGTFNPFDYVDVSFSGTSPNGSVNITPDYNQPMMQYVKFSADKEDGLKSGDTITVSAEITGSMDSFVKQFGVGIGTKEQKYTVDELAKYVTDISEIPSDMYSKMDKQLQDDLTSDFAGWDGENLHSMQLLGNYLLTLKDGMEGDCNNYLYYVYKVTASNTLSEGFFNFYWYGYFKDVMILKDGMCTVDLSSYKIPKVSAWSFSGEEVHLPEGTTKFVYPGYTDLDSLFNKHVVSKIDCYEYTSTVEDSIEEEDSTENEDYVTTYQDYFDSHSALLDEYYKGRLDKAFYSFIDFDKDNVPELVIGYYGDGTFTENEDGSMEIDSYEELADIYSLIDGEVRLIKQIDELDFGWKYSNDEKQIYVSGGSGAEASDIVYTINSGELKFEEGIYIEMDEDTGDSSYYELTGEDSKTSLSENEYNEKFKKIEKKVSKYIDSSKVQYFESIEKAYSSYIQG